MKSYKKTALKIAAILVVMTGNISCQNNSNILPTNQAQGRIIALLGPCNGNGLMIEVSTPTNIGASGSYSYNGSILHYNNTIVVQHLWKGNVAGSEGIVPEVGMTLIFEYRDITSADDTLFAYNGICQALYAPPSVPYYVITKFNNFKN